MLLDPASRSSYGWSAEIRIPLKSLLFRRGLGQWGFNVQRRIQRLQETDRWSSAEHNYKVTHGGRAGLLTGPRRGSERAPLRHRERG